MTLLGVALGVGVPVGLEDIVSAGDQVWLAEGLAVMEIVGVYVNVSKAVGLAVGVGLEMTLLGVAVSVGVFVGLEDGISVGDQVGLAVGLMEIVAVTVTVGE